MLNIHVPIGCQHIDGDRQKGVEQGILQEGERKRRRHAGRHRAAHLRDRQDFPLHAQPHDEQNADEIIRDRADH
jgi:hypothetical protein